MWLDVMSWLFGSLQMMGFAVGCWLQQWLLGSRKCPVAPVSAIAEDLGSGGGGTDSVVVVFARLRLGIRTSPGPYSGLPRWLPPMVLVRVACFWWPSFGVLQVLLLWSGATRKPCVQQ